MPARVFALMGVKVVSIACGRTHSVAIQEGGTLLSWGCGDDGVLGHKDTRGRSTPTPVALLSQFEMVDVACGSRHTLALTACGKVLLLLGLERKGVLELKGVYKKGSCGKHCRVQVG